MSKGLEALQLVKEMVITSKIKLTYYNLSDEEYAKKVSEFKNEKIKDIEKELKALEIIKEMIKVKNYGFCSIFDKWFIDIGNRRFYFETQEEFDLLKEVLL